MTDQPCHLAGMHPADCPAYLVGIADLRQRLRAAHNRNIMVTGEGKAAYERGIAEGRRQATEDWDREWGLSLHGHPAQCVLNEHAARGIAADPSAPDDTKLLYRLVGPWEPAEPAGGDRG